MFPSKSYTIWFSQRTGSTLLGKALELTGIAGHPHEWLSAENFKGHYGQTDLSALRTALWDIGTTPNGVLGVKQSFYEPHMTQLLDLLRQFPGPGPVAQMRRSAQSRPAVWERAFPNHQHIFMTRRNKVRLAVSWWKAIQTQEWHRQSGSQQAPRSQDLADAYHFDAINQLYTESVMREAGMQEFFTEGGIAPLTVVYEDFILDYESTIRQVLDFLGLDSSTAPVKAPYYARLADEISDAWAERFRQERQSNWDHHGW